MFNMSEGFANNALAERATMLESERLEWQKKLAPAKPRVVKASSRTLREREAQQKKINLFKRIFGL